MLKKIVILSLFILLFISCDPVSSTESKIQGSNDFYSWIDSETLFFESTYDIDYHASTPYLFENPIDQSESEITIEMKKISGSEDGGLGIMFNKDSSDGWTFLFVIYIDGDIQILSYDSDFVNREHLYDSNDADVYQGYNQTNILSVQEYDSDGDAQFDSLRFLVNNVEKCTVKNTLLNGIYGPTTDVCKSTVEDFPATPVRAEHKMLSP